MTPPRRSTPLALGALGVVFGDIGTSPLYTLKTVLDASGRATPEAVLGIVSLLVWTLVIVTGIKYATLAMRIDNDGEGGILALMALLGVKRAQRPLIVAGGLFGAALIYGDGAITPAISVLSALEGLILVEPALQHWVLPLTVAILVALFAIQPYGTAQIGRAFGPVMALWFIVMAVLGIGGIVRHPDILWALNPWRGIDFLAHSGGTGFALLGGIFLCATGAEALYADMGHFGAGPIRLAWSALVFPSLVLNYAGQGALVLAGAPTDGNLFYRLSPAPLTLPLVLLSTVATIIASQSIITGAFSMTRQAIQLGWMPRLRIAQTSAEGYGQIYVGAVNWTLMIVTVALALGFRKSDNLAAAYGIAVSLTMLMTTVLLFIAMREIWRWPLVACVALAGVFFVVDSAFVASNLLKLMDGGYVPLLLAAAVYAVMLIWHKGTDAVSAALQSKAVPVPEFLAGIAAAGVARVDGVAVFLSRTRGGAPALLQWYVAHSHALQRQVISLRLEVMSVPAVAPAERLAIVDLAGGYRDVQASYGFMERADLSELMRQVAASCNDIDPAALCYFVGQERVVAREDGSGLPAWLRASYAFLLRNSARLTDFLRVPKDRLIEIGRQVEI